MRGMKGIALEVVITVIVLFIVSVYLWGNGLLLSAEILAFSTAVGVSIWATTRHYRNRDHA
jgi:hypothetical protein